MESSMARHHHNNLLVLPWSEPGKWVFQNADTHSNIVVCSVPELHVKRSIPNVLRSSINIARRIRPNDCLVTWEASTAIATSFAIRVRGAKNPWVALGIIPKSTSRTVNQLLSSSLKRASIVTCFSRADIPTLQSTTGVHANDVTPTVWQQSDRPLPEKSKDWVSVGDSNRDDLTLARAAEDSGIVVDRFTRKVAMSSSAMSFHVHSTAEEIDNAFKTYKHHLAILKSTAYASGFSIAVRAGFARQLLIASDTPHMRELVTDGENGLLVNVEDSDHLADVIRAVRRGDVDVDRLSGTLHTVCNEDHTYPVLRRHIEKMVAMCS